jgi:hypothetical protein
MNIHLQLHLHASSAQAAMNACDIINGRLVAIKLLQPKATWQELISLAALDSVDLVAEG